MAKAVAILLALASLIGIGRAADPEPESPEEFLPWITQHVTREVSGYRLTSIADGSEIGELLVPGGQVFDKMETGFPALDLKDVIGHYSKQDPSLHALALEMSAFGFVSDTQQASLQLLWLRALAVDQRQGLRDLGVKIDPVPGATEIRGEQWSLIILHPANIPTMVAAIRTTEGTTNLGLAIVEAGILALLAKELRSTAVGVDPEGIP